MKSHNVYNIVRDKTFIIGEENVINEITTLNIAAIGKYLLDYYSFTDYVGDYETTNLKTTQGDELPREFFEQENNLIKLKTDNVKKIIMIPGIESNIECQLIQTNDSSLTISGRLLYSGTTLIGYFIPNINVLLLNATGAVTQLNTLTIRYGFVVHQLQYLCSIPANEMNDTTNQSMYYLSGDQVMKRDGPFITTIGLYGDKDGGQQLLAIAKLSYPIIKSKKIPTSILVTMDYVE